MGRRVAVVHFKMRGPLSPRWQQLEASLCLVFQRRRRLLIFFWLQAGFQRT